MESSHSSSSMFDASSSSLSSLSSESLEAPECDTGGDRFYVVLIRGGSARFTPDVVEFTDVVEGLKYFYDCLELRRRGKFFGKILAFSGRMVDYTEPESKYRVTLGGKTLELSDDSDSKFVGRTGG